MLIIAGAAVAAAFVAGLLVGKKNPSLATSAAAIVKAGETEANAAIAAAKTKLKV